MCACGTKYWTTYSYDPLGRTGWIELPDGTGTITYGHAGNVTTVTDAAGKWKTYTVDPLGNLVQVTEPNPGGGDPLQTAYEYNLLNQLARVRW